MIIEFHTPKGIVIVDTETVTDDELTLIGLTRQGLTELIPVDIEEEIRQLKLRLNNLEGVSGPSVT